MSRWSGRSSPFAKASGDKLDRPALALFVALTAACQPSPEPDTPADPPPPAHAARALRDITVPRTAERVARGKYLAEGLLQCFLCHSERDWTKPGAPPIAATKGAGAVWPDRPWLVAPNLTPDPETGTGKWTDDMLLRAIREGISHDGRVLYPEMPYNSFHALADEDVEAVVAYLRSLAPIRNPLPRTSIPEQRATKLKPIEPITATIAYTPTSDPVQRGRRLAMVADCIGCHTSWYTPHNPGYFAGGNLIKIGTKQAYSANITFAASGLAHYDDAFFREVLRTGKAKGRELSPLMPWIVFRNLSDDDLNALFAYLKAVPPVKHVIDNVDTPTKCEICGGEHPLGRYNRLPPLPALREFTVASMRDTVGRYRFEEGLELQVGIGRGRLWMRFQDGNPCALGTTDGKMFSCKDDLDHVEFVRDAAGHVTSLINNRTDVGQRVK
jgi:mono/diheme cytochrome c family protein